MPEQIETREALFVVRMWWPGGNEPQATWRGRVEHITSGQRRYFSNLVELCEFISVCEKTLGSS